MGVLFCDCILGLQASSIQSSIMGSIQMDNSFVVLPKKRAQVPSVPAHHHIGNPLSDTTNAKKTIEDSFIVLPPAAASIYKSKSVAEGVEAHLATGGNTNSSAFHSTVDVLQRAFEIASNQTQVIFFHTYFNLLFYHLHFFYVGHSFISFRLHPHWILVFICKLFKFYNLVSIYF